MQQLGLEIVKTIENHREDIFFVAVMIMILIVLFEMYEIDMFKTGSKKHVNVITIEGMKVGKNNKKQKKQQKVKAEHNKLEGYSNQGSLVKQSGVIEGLTDAPPAGTPAAHINQVAKHGPTALRLGSEFRSARNNINNQWQEAMCRSNDPK